MSRRLRSGAPRLLGYHGGTKGRWYAEHYQDLAGRFGPFDSVLRSYAGSVSALWVAWREATEAVVHGQWLLRKGRDGARVRPRSNA
jgi:hypothetical protein